MRAHLSVLSRIQLLVSLAALAFAYAPLAHAYAKLGSTWPSGAIPLRLQRATGWWLSRGSGVLVWW
jgi:hypothetical protein